MRIPSGKKLRINKNGSPVVPGVPMILEEDITLSLSSEFSPLFGGGDNKILRILETSGRISKGAFGVGFSTKFKQFGLQVWRSTDPLSFQATVGFYVNKERADAFNQVYKPIMTLAQIPLPDALASGILVPPGPTEVDLIDKSQNDIYSLEIGSMLRIDQIIIKKAEPTLSTETDNFGYPIWGKIALDIQSVFTATKNLVDPGRFAGFDGSV